MFALDDPIRKDFEFLQSTFGVSDLVVFAYRDPDLWAKDGTGLERLKRIRERIEQVPGIATAMDLSRIDQMLGQLEQPFAFLGTIAGKGNQHPLLNTESSIAIEFKNIFEGQTHSRDGSLVAVACILQAEDHRSVATKLALEDLRQVANSLPAQGLPKGMLVGQPVMIEEGFDEIESDGLRLSVVSTISLAILVLIGFRSVRWALISIAVVQWSLIVTRGILAWLDWDLTMVSSMLASIITVIGVATTVHWMLGYQRAMKLRLSPESALRGSMHDLWRPIVWACITDAIGFASLSFAKVGPVQDYGCMMAIGSLVVMVGIFLLVPVMALVPLAPSRIAQGLGLSYELRQIPGDALLRQFLLWLLGRIQGSFKTISYLAIALFGIAVIGSVQLKVETDFIKNFNPASPLSVAYRAVESELGGAGVWDIILPIPKRLSQEYLDQVMVLQENLRAISIPGPEPLRLSKVLSFADADQASRSSPVLGRLSIEARLIGMQQIMGSFVETLVSKQSEGRRYLRIMLRSREQSEALQKEQLIAGVRRVVAITVGSLAWKGMFEEGFDSQNATVSGYYVLLAQLVSSVVSDQWRCFAVATFGIWIAMSFALRSPWLALVAILPNALPSFCILGWMGWTGMRVNLGAAMIAAVSMGLSVDSSLHYLIRYQHERTQGHGLDEALAAAQSDIGLAILLSTLALVLGFGALATSNFLPTVVFGTMASISMVGGLFGNLFILPALLKISQGPVGVRAIGK